ncbi:sodium-coupled monocarboxylate transporter 1-like [Watersipora subatra]|uniref:sodium-coupled monocarboxylate transporter 1-like n=1 Tax=Watersipora subatra TaxID=2589382 RepID=UPI00355BE6A8
MYSSMEAANSTSTDDIVKRFAIADYVVFFLSLALSAAIGVYFGCTGKKQRTTQEFLLADRSMSIGPVTLSIFASFISAITIIGQPAETYTYGIMYIWVTLSYIPAILISTYVFLPVFYNLEITSLYEYLELRFNRASRIIAAACFILQTMMYMAVVVYGPSLAISAVTGLNTWLSVIAISVVCIFYTSLGGMKAVLWTDTLQSGIMFAGIFAVLIQGFIISGWDQVWKDASESGRLDISVDPNPLERNTVWSLAIGFAFYWTAIYSTNQTQFQRALTIPTLRKAQMTLWLNLPLLIIVTIMSSVGGLVIYSYFKDCDPLTSGRITAVDQLHPLFVMEALGHLPGLPGLIVAAIASGSLSTVSSGLNSLSAVILIDIINPLRKTPLSEKFASMFTRVTAVVLGLIVIAFTFLISVIGGAIIQTATVLVSTCSGPVLGLFTLGIIFPCANGKGAVVGVISSLAITAWIGFGASFNPPYTYKYPTSIEGCPADVLRSNSSLTTASTNKTVEELIAESRTGIQALYSISYLWFTLIGVLVCLIFGLIASFITGGNDIASLDSRLISPVADGICCCLPKRYKKYFYCGVDHHGKYLEESTSYDLKKEEAVEDSL